MKRLPKLFGLFVFVASIQLCTMASARKKLADETYVRSFPQTITVRTFLGEKISTFYLEDRNIGQSLRYLPNNNLQLGFGVTLRGIGLNFSTKLPGHDTKEDLYGKTKRYDIQVHSYSRRLMLDAYMQQYTGFHLNNKEDLSYNPGPTEYPYFQNLRARAISLSGLYVFNGGRYSLRTLINQQEWQLKSAGSLLLGMSAFYHLYSDDNTIIPRNYRYPDFFEGRHPKEIEYYGLTVNAGYGYTFVFGNNSHYYVAAAADGGLGPGFGQVTDVNDGELKETTYCLSANLRFGLGYNSNKWCAGLYGIYHTDRYPLPYTQSALSSSQGIARVVVARRISTRKHFLAKQPD